MVSTTFDLIFVCHALTCDAADTSCLVTGDMGGYMYISHDVQDQIIERLFRADADTAASLDEVAITIPVPDSH